MSSVQQPGSRLESRVRLNERNARNIVCLTKKAIVSGVARVGSVPELCVSGNWSEFFDIRLSSITIAELNAVVGTVVTFMCMLSIMYVVGTTLYICQSKVSSAQLLRVLVCLLDKSTAMVI